MAEPQTPLCPYFNSCGGCSAQHIPYELQLENKKNRLSSLIKFPEIKVFHGSEYFYRNRMDFVFCREGLGLRKKGDWKKIIPVEKCVISNEALNRLMQEIKGFFNNADYDVDYFDILKHTGTFYYAIIRTPAMPAMPAASAPHAVPVASAALAAPACNSAINFVLNEESSNLSRAVDKIKAFAKVTSANNILVTYVPPEANDAAQGEFFIVKGSEMISENYLGRKFHYSARGFFQNNTSVAELMQKYCNELLKEYEIKKSTKQSHLLDLYAGVGTFGIINAGLFKEVTMVESIQQCIDAANMNIKENSLKNAKAVLLDAKQLRKLSFPQELFVITDPPRSGMDQRTIDQLKKLKPKVIIYISCNPEQLARDIPKFKEYKIKTAALFDMFPQTNHMEAVVEMVLKD